MKYLLIALKILTAIAVGLCFFSVVGILCMIYDGEKIEMQVVLFTLVLSLMSSTGILLVEKYDVEDED